MREASSSVSDNVVVPSGGGPAHAVFPSTEEGEGEFGDLTAWYFGIDDEQGTITLRHWWEEEIMIRKASALWEGGLKDGNGLLTTGSGVLSSTQYSFGTRFAEGKGTNPEELVAAAHAGCFSMALSAELEKVGIIPERITTSCTVTFEKLEAGWTVVESHLEVTASIPGADRVAFESAAVGAKTGCPISRLLNAKISMNARLED